MIKEKSYSYLAIEKDVIDGIYEIYEITLQEHKPLEAIGLKLTEEVGELAEQINVLQGHLKHKVLKEPIEAEIADVLNCTLCILFKAYPDLNVFEILSKLAKAMADKNGKWQRAISTK